jgi:hypothetical protein
VVAQAIGRRPGEEAGKAPGIFKIGIAWQGNRDHPGDRWRSFPLIQFGCLARLPGVALISLQQGDGVEQLAELAGRFEVTDPCVGSHERDDQRDFLDTAALLSGLDLVVAPDTSIAHLAGSLGVPVWVALSKVGEWRWLIDRNDSPWYPTMRLFRQRSLGDWDDVFERMARTLEEKRSGCKR